MKHWRQFRLKSGDAELVCWLENDDRLDIGVRITLREIPDQQWTILNCYEPVVDQPPLRRWRVGGLA